MKKNQKLFFLLIVILFLLLKQISALRPYLIDQKFSFYSTDKQLQAQTNQLISSNNDLYSKKFCQNDKNYSYLDIKNGNRNKFEAIIQCNIHARQVITSQICLELIKTLIKHSQITNEMNFKIFYRANKRRNQNLKSNNHCIRKNQNQVDLNRNFPTQFNFYKVKRSSQIYPGPKPFSQTYTFCLNQIIQKSTLDFFLDIHSGQKALYYQQGVNNDKQIKILNNLQKQYPNLNIKKITTLKKDGQSINGHIFADLKVRKNVPYSLLYQIYGQQTSNCFQDFNPSNKNSMNKCKKQWTSAILFTIKSVIRDLKANQNAFN